MHTNCNYATCVLHGGGQNGSAPLRKLAIVGSHPATRELAPYDDKEYEIWLFNESPQKPEVYRRWDASFQLHLPEVYASTQNWVNKDHWAWLQQDHGDRVIWMQDVDPRVPNSKKFPLDDILKMTPYRYLRSTPALALALAIHLGYKHIALYGSELSSNTEYGYQAVNYAFWIGFAHGHGVDLDLQCWQSEFFQPIYGYEGELQVPEDIYKQRLEDIRPALDKNRSNFAKLKDRISDAMMDNDYQKVASLSLDLELVAQYMGEAEGAYGEAKRYAERTNPISRQEFERVSAQAQMDGDKAKNHMNHESGKCEYVWNVWRMSGRLDALNQFREFLNKKTELAVEMGRQLGIMRENLQYINEYDNLITAAGGQRAVYQAERVMQQS